MTNKKRLLSVSLVVALLIVLTGLYAYRNMVAQKEIDAYVAAMSSDEAEVLRGYLDAYPGAPLDHRDSVEVKLLRLGQSGDEDSIHDHFADELGFDDGPSATDYVIDSIDWAEAEAENTPEAYLAYIERHANGMHVVEAIERFESMDRRELKAGERSKLVGLLTSLLASLASGDAEEAALLLASTPDTTLAARTAKAEGYAKEFQSEADTIATDLVSRGDWSIAKRSLGPGVATYDATFTVDKCQRGADASAEAIATYAVRAHVTSGWKVTAMEILEE